jgi:predicted branched-subunit amino acid permease
MSTCVFNRMESTHPAARLFSAFFVTDESFAIFTTGKDEHRSVWFFLGLTTVTYSFWNLGTLVGAVASALLPDILSASLVIALYAMFIALLLPGLPGNRRLTLLVVLTAVCNTLLSQTMDSSWALISSTLLCAFLGTFFVDPDPAEKEADV